MTNTSKIIKLLDKRIHYTNIIQLDNFASLKVKGLLIYKLL